MRLPSLNKMKSTELANFLLEFANFYENPTFISDDPIGVVHEYQHPQDREIFGFIVATISWGARGNIINSAKKLSRIMGESPYDFVMNWNEPVKNKQINSFVHRTFNGEDLGYFLGYFHRFYITYNSLETAFTLGETVTEHMLEGERMQIYLRNFRNNFFAFAHPKRTEKHVSNVDKNSACKRINMYLRWMVRKNSSVDFGIWNQIAMKDLHLPLDVHVIRVAKELGFIEKEVADWQQCVALTSKMRTILPEDPAKLDYALFGMGIEMKKKQQGM